MQNFAAARRTMVDCQVRTFDVTSLSVIAAFDAVPRETYAPAQARAIAYGDAAISLGRGRVMLPPLVVARMLQALGPVEGLKTLVVGVGSGYECALLAHMGATVIAVEADETLAGAARANLDEAGVAGVTVVNGAFAAGHAPDAPYDAILVNGGYQMLPDALPAQLADGGALVGIEAADSANRIIITRRSAGVNSHAVVVNAWAPVLPGLEKPAGFTF